ncbi:MAG: prepilin-type N-terminal cleavage/methylation domain-containing protein [Tissierellia bacterium]|nr:prepilin-type N-terminal cleavage/methylation domain-containing protein [Tissierellia bacterium]
MIKDNRGVTFIELIIVISILSLLLIIPVLKSSYLVNYKERQELMEFKKDLNFARNRAIVESKLYGVQIRPDKTYLIIKYDRNPEIIKRKELDSALRIKSTNIGGNEVVFTYSGTPKEAGTIFLENQKGREIKITITPATGKINIYYDQEG